MKDTDTCTRIDLLVAKFHRLMNLAYTSERDSPIGTRAFVRDACAAMQEALALAPPDSAGRVAVAITQACELPFLDAGNTAALLNLLIACHFAMGDVDAAHGVRVALVEALVLMDDLGQALDTAQEGVVLAGQDMVRCGLAQDLVDEVLLRMNAYSKVWARLADQHITGVMGLCRRVRAAAGVGKRDAAIEDLTAAYAQAHTQDARREVLMAHSEAQSLLGYPHEAAQALEEAIQLLPAASDLAYRIVLGERLLGLLETARHVDKAAQVQQELKALQARFLARRGHHLKLVLPT